MATMLSTTRSTAALALRGMSLHSSALATNTDRQPSAKPATSLLLSRLGPAAYISSTSSKPATAITRSQDAHGPPLTATGKPRREVPLPSQEKKEGAMQYALYVSASYH